MDISQDKIYEALGLEVPQEGGNEQTVAESAGEQAEQTQTQTEPADDGGMRGDPQSETETGRQEQTEQTGRETPEGGEQTPEQRREFAARRRRAETQTAIDEALRAEREKTGRELEEFFQDAGLVNTLTGEPIQSMEQFRAWRESFDAAKLEQDLQAGKLTRQTLETVINDSPVMQQARQLVEQERQRREQADMEAARAQAEAELAEIHKLDGSIRTMDDLVRSPKAEQIYRYVQKGNSLVDAYYLANREELEQRRAQAYGQQVLNNARGKDHLATAAGRGAGALSVPGDELRLFREINPGATDAEIQAYYNKYNQK